MLPHHIAHVPGALDETALAGHRAGADGDCGDTEAHLVDQTGGLASSYELRAASLVFGKFFKANGSKLAANGSQLKKMFNPFSIYNTYEQIGKSKMNEMRTSFEQRLQALQFAHE